MKRRLPTMDLPLRRRQCGEASLVERNEEPCGVQLVNVKATTRNSPTDLVELAREIQTANSIIQTSTLGKLQLIAEQVRFLQSQARKILEDMKHNSDLHQAACNFRKLPGHVYHLYQRPSGQKYFSMLSPQEWGGQNKCPHPFLGTYRLEEDMSWTPEERIQEQTYAHPVFEMLLGVNPDQSQFCDLKNT